MKPVVSALSLFLVFLTSASGQIGLDGTGVVNGYFIGPNVDLSDADLYGADLSGADLSGADLTGAFLVEVNLSDVNLSGADLSGVSWWSTTGTPIALPDGFELNGGDLYKEVNGYLLGRNVDLTNADLSNADLSNFSLFGADLSGADLTNADLSGADLSGANLDGVNLSDVDLSGAFLSGCAGTPIALPDGFELNDGELYKEVNGYLVGPNVDLTNADLSGADLSDVLLFGADLSGADLSGADLSGTSHYGNYLSNTDLSGADLSGADLTRIASGLIEGTPVALPDGFQLINGYLVGPSAFLIGADLSGANLIGVNLEGAYLGSANLSGANLSGANLSGANLNNVEISDTTAFTGANLVNAISNDVILSAAIDIQTKVNSNTERINQMENQLTILIDSLAQKDAVIDEKNERIAQLEDLSAVPLFNLLLEEKEEQIAALELRPTQAAYDTVVTERDARPTLGEIQDARTGSVILTPSEDGTVQLRIEIEESSDLEVWENQGKSVEAGFPLAEGKKFLRFALK
ncbi:pentapeptide repeat-containing protein [bacterium]|nr:pentapeptide repeat-containing protein [bacterium]